MVVSLKTLRLLAGLAAACAAPHSAQAQWFPPLGAAPPEEIAQRLSAQGYVLIGPLRRNQTVYLADVNAGAAGRERLVIDAWSGEILQRFVVVRPRSSSPGYSGYAVEGGEFSAPPPLGPPPARDFFSPPGNYAYGAPSEAPPAVGPINPPESPSRARIRSRPASAPHKAKPASATAPSEQAAKPPSAGASGTAPPAEAPAAAPASGPSAAPAAAASAPASVTDKGAAGAAAAPAETQVKNSPAPQPAAAPPATEKAGGKTKANDVPVNPLE